MENKEKKMSNEERAREIARNKIGFFTHLLVYIVVISFLTALNFFQIAKSGKNYYWFFWPAGGWGIGLFFHFISTFVGGGSLEAKIAQKELDRLNRMDPK